MRIAIPAPLATPATGGGYTFEQELFEALLPACAKRAIRPVLVVRSRDEAREGFDAVVVDVSPASDAGWRSVAHRIRDAFPQGRAAWRRLRQPEVWRPVELTAERLRSTGAEFLIHLGPIPICYGVPFSTIMWDLGHRDVPYFPELSERGEWTNREQLYRQSLPRASLVVTGTAVGRDAVEFYYRVRSHRILLLPLPTPRDATALAEKPSPRRPAWMPQGRPALLYPAQFWAHKNHASLIRALAVLRDVHGSPFNLVLPGSDKGNLAHVRRLVAEHRLEASVHIPGFVPRDELLAAYRFADALVFPSFLGPDNLPPLEAFAMGCPVIAADAPGAREQLDDAALLVDPADSAAFAAEIHRVVTTPRLRATLIDRGRLRARTRTSDQFATKLLDAVLAFGRIRASWGS